MTDGERIDILEGKIAFLMALTKVHGQRLERLENVPPSEDPPPLPICPECVSEESDIDGKADGERE